MFRLGIPSPLSGWVADGDLSMGSKRKKRDGMGHRAARRCFHQ